MARRSTPGGRLFGIPPAGARWRLKQTGPGCVIVQPPQTDAYPGGLVGSRPVGERPLWSDKRQGDSAAVDVRTTHNRLVRADRSPASAGAVPDQVYETAIRSGELLVSINGPQSLDPVAVERIDGPDDQQAPSS